MSRSLAKPWVRQQLEAAAALLEEDAQLIFDSNVVKVPGHPLYDQFDPDEASSRLSQRDYERRVKAAKGLRKLLEVKKT